MILCLDTSTQTARVGVVDAGGRLLASAEATADRHSANVLRLCDAVLREAGLAPAGLAALACGSGPGSFTGLRVGMSVIKGMALATGAPLVLVPSLQALAEDIAAAHPGARPVPCIDAGKGEVYAALGGEAARWDEGEPWRLTPADLAARLAASGAAAPETSWVVAGNGADRFAAALDAALPPRASRAAVAGPTSLSIGRLALARHAAGQYSDLATAVPLYGRPPDITLKKKPSP